MTKRLLESENLTFNLNTLGTAPAKPVETPSAATETPKTGSDDWKKPLLDDRKFQFKPGVIKKLDALGEPFKKALKVLGYNIELENGSNPLLAFVHGEFGQDRLLDGKLNASTFKAIYNAVSKHLVADSEFFEKNDYNILYCVKLYDKSPREIESYLTLQAQILKPSAQSYSEGDKNKNKKVFLQNANDELLNANLNSLERAKLIKNGGVSTEKVPLDAAGQNKILKAIKADINKIFATLVAISLNTGSKKAKQALTNTLFSKVTTKQLADATTWLAENNIITKGQLREEDADALVDKIISTLRTEPEQH